MVKGSKLRAIVCLNTGQVYRSIAEAAADNGVATSTIMRAIRADRMCGGKWYAEIPPEITSGQLDQWRMARLLGCVSFRLGSHEDNKNDTEKGSAS